MMNFERVSVRFGADVSVCLGDDVSVGLGAVFGACFDGTGMCDFFALCSCVFGLTGDGKDGVVVTSAGGVSSVTSSSTCRLSDELSRVPSSQKFLFDLSALFLNRFWRNFSFGDCGAEELDSCL